MKDDKLALRVHGAEFSLIIPPDSSNAVHFREVYERNGQYEAVMSAVVARLLAAMDRPVFADLGAFLGYYTLYAARLLAGRGEVFAVESNPAYAETVRAALVLNGIEGVPVLNVALSDREETLWSQGTTLHDGSAREDSIFLATPEHVAQRKATVPGVEGEAVAVEAVTLDSLCEVHGLAPTIAKMDVHGTEGKIIRGMRKVLRGPLQCLLLELHQNVYLRKYAPDVSRMEILDELEDAGFHNYYIAGHRYTYSDGLKVFLDAGRFSWQPLTRETRGMLLFDRTTQVFVLSSKIPVETLLGPSALDPSLE